MGRRTEKSKKLVVQKETLRKLQLRPMTDEQLRAVAGGWVHTRCCEAPSQLTC